MGKYFVDLSARAQKELSMHYRSGDKATIKKIEKILQELSDHPFTGVGNPEILKHKMSGAWSRRLNGKDRIVYSVEEDFITVFVASAIGHYD